MTVHHRHVRRGGLVVGAVVALLVTACSNSGDDSSSKTSASAAATTAAPSTSAAAATTAAASPSSGAATTEAAATTTTLDLSKNVPLKDVPGVSDTEIKFASFGTNSNNPLGTCVLDCYDAGIKAYFEYRNSQGGIWGRKLVLAKELDDALTQNQQRALDIVSANDTFASFSATQLPSGWADIAKAGIPLYVWGIHFPQMLSPNIFGYSGVQCQLCTSRLAAFEVKLAGGHKVASLGYGISENSKLCAEQSIPNSIKKYGAQIGGAEMVYVNGNLQFGLANGIAPEVTAIKESGADVVLTCMDLKGMKTLAQEMQRQGIRDKVKLLHPNTYNQDFVKEAGDLFEGDLVSVSFRPFEADPGTSSLPVYKEWMGKIGQPLSELAMIGWINADTAYTSIKLAGPEFSRKAAVEAMNKVTDYTASGLINPVDWSRQHELPTEEDPAGHGYKQDCYVHVQIKSGAFQVVGDQKKPWTCFPGNTREWSEPVSTDFS